MLKQEQFLSETNKNNSITFDSMDYSSKGKDKKDRDFDFKIISIKRVTKMYKGGRRMKISVFVAVGDKKGKIGLGIGKSDDVKTAQDKAIQRAKKTMFKIPLKGTTLPHSVEKKFGSAKIVLKPAAPGTGIIAGSSVRMIMELSGVKDVLSKILGTRNSIANAYCTVEALKSLRLGKL